MSACAWGQRWHHAKDRLGCGHNHGVDSSRSFTWRRPGGVTAKVVKMTYSPTEHYYNIIMDDDSMSPMDDVIMMSLR